MKKPSGDARLASASQDFTVGQCFDLLTRMRWRKLDLSWPPDLFALAGTVLHKSGAYISVVKSWPPKTVKFKKHSSWCKFIQDVGRRWRKVCLKGRRPPEVDGWWRHVTQAAEVCLRDLQEEEHRLLCEALLQICAAADEACRGIGIDENSDEDAFVKEVESLTVEQVVSENEEGIRTVCKRIDPSVLCVLPKLRTPRFGMTIRSMSHHLALCPVGEVTPKFITLPNTSRVALGMNLLLVPWPTRVGPRDFAAVKGGRTGLLTPKEFGYFDYKIRGGECWPRDEFETLLKAAKNQVGRVDGVVFPELALKEAEVKEVWGQVAGYFPEAFFVGGIAREEDGHPVNSASCILPAADPAMCLQDKHHSWALTDTQIAQYGLGESLDPDCTWWENTMISKRSVKFIKVCERLVLCCLVCEDLARQDPVSELVRSVGPNLVIGLLMDGPQLVGRWPARYATVLADDPGSSVLTLTSLGMARMSKPFGQPESRVIALWKDAWSGPFQIDLPYDASAVVLSLALLHRPEWTADGRGAGRKSGSWVLRGVHSVRAKGA